MIDETDRLVYADWLEEHGRPDEAFIWRDVLAWAARGHPLPPTRYNTNTDSWSW